MARRSTSREPGEAQRGDKLRAINQTEAGSRHWLARGDQASFGSVGIR
jgi:hypothetical protein